MDKKSKPKPKNVKKQSESILIWPLKILILSFALSMCFGVLSEIVLSGTGILIAILIIVVFVGIAIISDMIGVAVTSANPQPFLAMASKKVRGAKESLKLISMADKVSSICCDVVGDVCGILSGAAGASIVVKIAIESSSALNIIIASLISAIVAAITISGKAICKKFAIKKSTNTVLMVGKVISLFTPQPKTQKKQTEKDFEQDVEVESKSDTKIENNEDDTNNTDSKQNEE